MIREASQRAARLLIYRAKQTEETPGWRLQSGDAVTTCYLHSGASAAAAGTCAGRAGCLSRQVVEKMMLRRAYLKMIKVFHTLLAV